MDETERLEACLRNFPTTTISNQRWAIKPVTVVVVVVVITAIQDYRISKIANKSALGDRESKGDKRNICPEDTDKHKGPTERQRQTDREIDR